MSDNSLTNPTPRFGTAEYSSKSGPDRCKTCNQPIVGEYFRVNGALACTGCAQQVQQRIPKDTHATFVRGILFGVGGALAGLVLYATVGIITGWRIGFVSLAVGYIVAKAVMTGSKGIGGRRYQIAAVLLTYAAVSIAAVPIAISQYIKSEKANPATHAGQPQSGVAHSGQASPPGLTREAPEAPSSPKPKMSGTAALGKLVLLGLASPFLEFSQDPRALIGFIILFVGLKIAWQLTAGTRMDVLGPFKVQGSPATAAQTG